MTTPTTTALDWSALAPAHRAEAIAGANERLEGAPAGRRAVRAGPPGGLLDAGHDPAAPVLRGVARRQGAVPADRVPLCGDVADAGRGSAPAADHGRRGAAPPDRGRAGRGVRREAA